MSSSVQILTSCLDAFNNIKEEEEFKQSYIEAVFSDSIVAQANSFQPTRKKQYLLSRLMLRQLLISNHYLNHSQKLPEIELDQNQRPKFVQAEYPDFNLSHSGNYLAVGIVSKGKIGLDLEINRARPSFFNIAKQFFSESEQRWIQTQNDPLSTFWQLWVMREAALKLYSKGVWQMKQLQIKMPEKQIKASFSDDFYPEILSDKACFFDACFLGVCSNLPIDEINIHKFNV